MHVFAFTYANVLAEGVRTDFGRTDGSIATAVLINSSVAPSARFQGCVRKRRRCDRVPHLLSPRCSKASELCAFHFLFSSVFFSSPQATCLTHCRTGFRTRSWYLISSCWPTNPITHATVDRSRSPLTLCALARARHGQLLSFFLAVLFFR